MANSIPMQACPFSAFDCAAINERGRCAGVIDIQSGPDKTCPFFKTIDQNYDEHCAAMDRLARRGRFDLLRKYHKKELYD